MYAQTTGLEVDEVRDDSQGEFVFGGKTELEFLDCECNDIELAILKVAGEKIIIPYNTVRHCHHPGRF